MEFSTMLKVPDERTLDVLSAKTFNQLLIHPDIICKIRDNCFYNSPTPVQAAAIPLGLLGNDLLVQAKSGTGKTLVFAVLAAAAVADNKTNGVAVVILAPVREIAYQIKDTIDLLTDAQSGVFIGGEEVTGNKAVIAQGCSIVIGTPGRLAQLVRDGHLILKESKLLVLDEADKLMEATFTDDIKHIYNSLNPGVTQVAAFSATYPNSLDQYLSGFMKSPTSIRVDSKDVQLLGIHQYAVVALHEKPVDVAVNLFSKITYAQCILFANSTNEGSNVTTALTQLNHRVAGISASLSQEERKKIITDLKNFAIRIMVSTDLTARGIDATNVNLVLNFGVPVDVETYFHRIGRAGRFGGNGAAITILTNPQEVAKFVRMAESNNIKVKLLDLKMPIPYDLTHNGKFYSESIGFVDSCSKIVSQMKAAEVAPTEDEIEVCTTTDVVEVKPVAEPKMSSPVPATKKSDSIIPPVSEVKKAVETPPASDIKTSDSTSPHAGRGGFNQNTDNVSSRGAFGGASRGNFSQDQSNEPGRGAFSGGRGAFGGGRGNFNNESESSRGAFAGGRGNFNNESESSRGAFAGGRGNFNNDSESGRGGRGAFGGGRGNFNNESESSRGAFAGGRGNFNNDSESGRGAFGGGRGNFTNESESGRGGRGAFGRGRVNFNDNESGRGAFGGSRGNFNNDNESGRGGRGTFAGSRGNFNQDQRNDSGRGGRGAFGGSRGSFNQDQGTDSGRGSFGGGRGAGRGSFNQGGDSGRGAFGGSRGSFHQEQGFGAGRGAFGGGRGTFNQDQGNDSGRGAFGGAGRGSFNQDQGFGAGRGAFVGQDQGNGRGAFGGRGRGSFGQENQADRGYCGGARGAASQENHSSFSVDSPPEQTLAQKLAALKSKSFGKNINSSSSHDVASSSPAEEVVVESDCKEVPNMVDESGVTIVAAAIEELSLSPLVSYSQKEMVAIQDSRSREEWIEYAKKKDQLYRESNEKMNVIINSKKSEDDDYELKSKQKDARENLNWDVNNSPFEFDMKLRIPFQEQIRVLRYREEQKLRERQEQLGIIKAEPAFGQKGAVKEEPVLAKKVVKDKSSGDVVYPSGIVGSTKFSSSPLSLDKATDLNDACRMISEFVQNFKSDECPGPAVFPRPSYDKHFQINMQM